MNTKKIVKILFFINLFSFTFTQYYPENDVEANALGPPARANVVRPPQNLPQPPHQGNNFANPSNPQLQNAPNRLIKQNAGNDAINSQNLQNVANSGANNQNPDINSLNEGSGVTLNKQEAYEQSQQMERPNELASLPDGFMNSIKTGAIWLDDSYRSNLYAGRAILAAIWFFAAVFLVKMMMTTKKRMTVRRVSTEEEEEESSESD